MIRFCADFKRFSEQSQHPGTGKGPSSLGNLAQLPRLVSGIDPEANDAELLVCKFVVIHARPLNRRLEVPSGFCDPCFGKGHAIVIETWITKITRSAHCVSAFAGRIGIGNWWY